MILFSGVFLLFCLWGKQGGISIAAPFFSSCSVSLLHFLSSRSLGGAF